MAVVRKIKAPGGMLHVHHDGRQVFVPAASPSGPIRPFQPMWAPKPQQRIRPFQPMWAPGMDTPGYTPPRATAASGGAVAGAPPQQQQATSGTPLDALYLQGAAARLQARNAALARYDRLDADDVTATTETLRRVGEQEPLAQQNANSRYNRQGLFYSSDLGQEKQRLATQFIRQRADIQAGQRSRETARAEARRALAAGATVEEAAAIAEAVDRQIARDTDAADANALVPNVPATPPAAPAAPAVPSPVRPSRPPRIPRAPQPRRRRRPRNTPGRFR